MYVIYFSQRCLIEEIREATANGSLNNTEKWSLLFCNLVNHICTLVNHYRESTKHPYLPLFDILQ